MAVKQVMKSCEKSFEFGSEEAFFIDKKPMEECVICMEPINDKDKAVLKCGHSFHASCMFSSVVKENNTCPLCRTEVSEKPEKKPEMTEGLMHIFIQNEFNRGNLMRATSAIFNRHRNWFENYGAERLSDATYEEVSVEERAYISEELVLVMVQFGMRLGGQVNNWIRDGDSRLHIPHEFTENEPIRVPLEAYMPIETTEGVEESKEDDDDGDSDTDSDADSMPSLMSVSEEDSEENDIEPLNLQALFQEEVEEPVSTGESHVFQESFVVESTEHILQTMSENNAVIDCFPHNDPGESTYFIERIRGNQWLYYNLADATIEEIMWPIGGPGARPLFTQQQAEAIFGEILRYHAEGLEP